MPELQQYIPITRVRVVCTQTSQKVDYSIRGMDFRMTL